MSRKNTGNAGEIFACNLLIQKGYKIVTRNFRCKLGEIDIICVKDGYLIFVEVKARYSNKFGKPEEAVTPRKLKTIYRVGEYFMKHRLGLPKRARVEVVAIDMEAGKPKNLRLIQA